MLSLFDPTLEPEPEPPQDLLKLIPMYRSPKIQEGILPGKTFTSYPASYIIKNFGVTNLKREKNKDELAIDWNGVPTIVCSKAGFEGSFSQINLMRYLCR